jgi:choline dehydrogenase-like flavoprotein
LVKDISFMSCHYLVVGSGTGGASIARELSKRGKKVTIIEAGVYPKLGTELNALNFYTGGFFGPGEFSKEKVEVLRTRMVGGSSVVTFGNGTRALQPELKSHGVDLETEFKEAESELNIVECPEDHMGERTKLLMKTSQELGYDWKPMPKYIDFTKCRGCGNCMLGCIYGAKWTSRNYIGDSYKYGAKLLTNHFVEKVLTHGDQVQGVRARTPEGIKEIEADQVVLSAGGLGTPVILLNSGLEAGSHFFADTLVNTFGIVKDASFKNELGMATIIDDFHDSEGYILSPTMEGPLDLLTDRFPLYKKHVILNMDKLIGVMTKTKDEANGTVFADGSFIKPVPEVDREKIDKGYTRSKELLLAAGVEPKSVFKTHIRAGHPGGTAGVGRVVDRDLETEVSGLYVCDCSVFPEAPGKPPVLTIVALAKYLAAKLAPN